jgi:hypothetical protein
MKIRSGDSSAMYCEYNITNSMEQSPSRQANSCLANQEITRKLLNLEVLDRIHDCLYPYPGESGPRCPTIYFNIILLSTSRCSQVISFLQAFTLKLCIWFSPVHATCPTHFIRVSCHVRNVPTSRSSLNFLPPT